MNLPPFPELVEQLKVSLSSDLPGEEAQNKMAPFERRQRREERANERTSRETPKLSAVLALLYPVGDVAYTVLLLRHAYDGIHSAQVGFPGGQKDKSDPNLLQTALRETHEEIGIDPSAVTIIGRLSPIYIEPSGFHVEVFVGYLDHQPEMKPDPAEVAKLLNIDLNTLMAKDTVKIKDMRISDGRIIKDTPYFDVHGHTVWGATAMMISEWKEVLAHGRLGLGG